MEKRKIFLIIGRTSSGKSAITRGACEELGLKQVRSFTTRPMRDSEKNDLDHCDHYFITADEVDKYRESIAAYTKIGDYEYFTTYKELDKSDCYVIDPIGVQSLIERCGDKYTFITVYIYRSHAYMERDYNNRSQEGDSFNARYDAEDEEFTKYEKAHQWDYCVDNNSSLNNAINKLKHIIINESSAKKWEHTQ